MLFVEEAALEDDVDGDFANVFSARGIDTTRRTDDFSAVGLPLEVVRRGRGCCCCWSWWCFCLKDEVAVLRGD